LYDAGGSKTICCRAAYGYNLWYKVISCTIYNNNKEKSYSIQHYVIQFVSGFLRFTPQIKLTATI
jgi:hypothetical protein